MALEIYRRVFANASFRWFWIGFSLSSIGDAMTRVALIWYVFEETDSTRSLGLLSVCFVAPVLVGGLLAGALLDRFDRRVVMLVDAFVRGGAVALIPLLDALGRLELWHVYAVAAVYGLLFMISLAGGPSLLPSIVPREQLLTVNALEVLSFTIGGVVGPPVAGLLIARFGAPQVLVIDALTYAFFALALVRVRTIGSAGGAAGRAATSTLRDAFELLTGNRVLLSTTLMYMSFNIGQGFLFVWLPVYSERTLGGGPELYGLLLGGLAVGQMASSFLAGSLALGLSLGTLICIAEVLSGAALLLLLASNVWLALLGVTLHGVFTAPLTIWAQTLRMAIIPEHLRGRTFALLRMLMQGTNPLGGVLAGLLLPALGIRAFIILTTTAISAAGVGGSRVRELCKAGQPEPEASVEAQVAD
jgi:MFS family permease